MKLSDGIRRVLSAVERQEEKISKMQKTLAQWKKNPKPIKKKIWKKMPRFVRRLRRGQRTAASIYRNRFRLNKALLAVADVLEQKFRT
ncbi:MAG: hypothetical protein Q4E89_08665 [Eubacteriales bacterium]|nr:hypothetical protein [Eubacteriales bacterium]